MPLCDLYNHSEHTGEKQSQCSATNSTRCKPFRTTRKREWVDYATCLVPISQHLNREHPHVADTTHDDRAEEGVYLGNDLTTPTFWLWSFRHRKAMRLSDPKHFDHILPFLQPADVHHSIPLNNDDIGRMHAIDDAATFEVGEHNVQTHAVGEVLDTGQHVTYLRADAPRVQSARMHAARLQHAGEQDAGDMPRVTRRGAGARCCLSGRGVVHHDRVFLFLNEYGHYMIEK